MNSNSISRLLFAVSGAVLLTSAAPLQGSLQKVSAVMTMRKAEKGKATTMKAELFYTTAGSRLVTHFITPDEYVLINNAKGEMTMYAPKDNSVMRQTNYMLSTESSQLYYFFSQKQGDLGLKAMGFILQKTSFDSGKVVTEWLPPMHLAQALSKVKLVHDGSRPIFMSYAGPDGKILKKSYFYNYTTLSSANISFPQAITSIHYTATGDSAVEKTTYTDLKVNAEASSPYFTFQVPVNAKPVKN